MGYNIFVMRIFPTREKQRIKEFDDVIGHCFVVNPGMDGGTADKMWWV
jgi:hypothetical protein